MKRLIVGLLLAATPAFAQTPAAKLGSPIPAVARGADPDPFQEGPRPPAARLGDISTARVGEGPKGASDEEKYNWGVPTRPASRTKDRDRDRRRDDEDRPGARLREPGGRLTSMQETAPPPPPPPGERMGEWFQDRGAELDGTLPPPFGSKPPSNRDHFTLQSDCEFAHYPSPISNPFLAEDPRSLSELRPLFLYQTIPGNQPYYKGGSAVFFGLQGRLAFTERLSVVLHKLGGVSISPGDGSVADGGTGLAEIWLGPKFVFWRDPENQLIASAGLMFQMPVGSSSVFQDTGKLTLVPYLSHARPLWKSDFGTFNLMNIVGYAVGTSSERSDYLFDTLHFDLDVADNHRFYPTLELSWFHYTSDGTARPNLGFEGRDLANVGASVGGRDFLTIAPGFRYKFNENWQVGVTAELPLIGTRDLLDFRLGVDLIWRY
ncbi:MAG TPA: hypothetical protein VM597_21555 [Gemmataceae bacterium]|nr:hypothetical protein [Gemmataceae bacterium]